LAAVALLCTLGVGYWLYSRAEQGTRAQEQALADLRGELSELRSRNAALSASLGQRAQQDRQVLEEKLSASQQQVEGLIAGARQDTQAVAGRLADLDQRLAALQAPGSSDERQDAELKQMQQQLGQIGKEVQDLGRALADVASEHANALAAAAQPVPAQPAWMGLVAELSSADEGNRWRAVLSLGETRDPAVSAYLLPVLKDEDIFVRMAAARTLGDLRAPDAVAALIEALGDPEPSVREAVYTALKAITKRELAFDALGEDGEQRARQIQAWRDWWAKEQARQGG
jgi:HEAT repeat protein